MVCIQDCEDARRITDHEQWFMVQLTAVSLSVLSNADTLTGWHTSFQEPPKPEADITSQPILALKRKTRLRKFFSGKAVAARKGKKQSRMKVNKCYRETRQVASHGVSWGKG